MSSSDDTILNEEYSENDNEINLSSSQEEEVVEDIRGMMQSSKVKKKDLINDVIRLNIKLDEMKLKIPGLDNVQIHTFF